MPGTYQFLPARPCGRRDRRTAVLKKASVPAGYGTKVVCAAYGHAARFSTCLARRATRVSTKNARSTIACAIALRAVVCGALARKNAGNWTGEHPFYFVNMSGLRRRPDGQEEGEEGIVLIAGSLPRVRNRKLRNFSGRRTRPISALRGRERERAAF